MSWPDAIAFLGLCAGTATIVWARNRPTTTDNTAKLAELVRQLTELNQRLAARKDQEHQ